MAQAELGTTDRKTASLAGQSTSQGAAARVKLVALGLAGALVLSACQNSADMDWDLRSGPFSTADAARSSAGNRPQADARGVISYPGYQVAVARRGETVRQLADRLGQNPAELARQNAIDADAPLRGGELMVLPGRISELGSASTSGASIATTTLAPVAGSASPAVAAGPEPVRHTVQRGETAFTIARLYNVSARSLAEWNGLSADMSVREGQMLMIPVPQSISDASGSRSAAAAPVAATTAPIVAVPTSTAQTGATQTAAAATATATAQSAPGQGTTTPVPPSAATPLPASNPSPAGNAGSSTAPATPPVADMGAQRTQGARLAMPVQGRVIRAYQRGRNDGIGIGASAGTNVQAAAAGTVAAITRDTDQVPILVIRHDNNLLTVYANIDNIRVERGARVSAGQTIATVRAGDPAYLHFEVREGFDSVDPMQYLQ